jgi:hypothetical protein
VTQDESRAWLFCAVQMGARPAVRGVELDDRPADTVNLEPWPRPRKNAAWNLTCALAARGWPNDASAIEIVRNLRTLHV